MRLPAVLLAGLAATLAGCSSVTGYFKDKDNTEPPAPLVEFEPLIGVDEVWSRNVGSGAHKEYVKLTPVLDGERIYAADRKGRVWAFDALTGSEIWEADTDLGIAGGPGAGDGMVAVGTSDGEVVALAADDGQVRWVARVSSEVLAAPQIAEGVVVVRTLDGKIFGLAAQDGARTWVYERTVPTLTLRGTSAPSLSRGAALAGFDNGMLVALALDDGTPLWEARIALPSGRSELERIVDIDAAPLVTDEAIYVATFQGRVAAVDFQSGGVLWRRDMSSHSGMSADSRTLYVSDADSHVWALDRFSSGSLWRQDDLQARNVSSPAVVDDYVVVGDLEGFVHWMRRTDGVFAARLRVDKSPIIASPVTGNGMVYVYTQSGRLVALRPVP